MNRGWIWMRRSVTSGSRVCCSSFCFRDVQGLNGFTSRVCMSPTIPSKNRLLPPTNEGNVHSRACPSAADTLSKLSCVKFQRLKPAFRLQQPLLPPAVRAACVLQPLHKQIQRRASCATGWFTCFTHLSGHLFE